MIKKYYKIIWVFVVALIIFLLLWLINSIKEPNTNKHKIWATTFGGGGQRYHNAANRLKTELSQINLFDNIIAYTDEYLKNDSEFWNKHNNFIINNSRGYGYWIWKPYIIMKTLDKLNDDDMLVYLDAGCEIVNNSDSSNKMNKLISDTSNITYTSTGHDEKTYTKMDLFKYMEVDKNMDILNSIMHQAGVIIIKKNKHTTAFMNEWYNIMGNYHLVDDSQSILKNDASFIEHRHDQSIFSLLIKTKYVDFNTKNNIIHDPYPILISRKLNE